MIAFKIDGVSYYKAPYNVRELKSNRICEKDVLSFLMESAKELVHFKLNITKSDLYYFEFRDNIFNIKVDDTGNIKEFGWLAKNKSNMTYINDLINNRYRYNITKK